METSTPAPPGAAPAHGELLPLPLGWGDDEQGVTEAPHLPQREELPFTALAIAGEQILTARLSQPTSAPRSDGPAPGISS